MEIGIKLKDARVKAALTQEKVAEEIQVSRQTISNWENERSYPDIISVMKLSDLYHISLDELLKGDQKMMEHLEESTNVVKSNKNLILAIGANIVIMVLIVFFGGIISSNNYMIAGMLIFAVLSSAALFYQIIRKF